MEHYKYIFIILTYKSTNDLPECIDSINSNVHENKIIIVNSHFDDASSKWFAEYSSRHGCDFIDVPNKGYGYGNNRGIEYAKKHYSFEFIVISNPDIIVKKFDDSEIEKLPYGVVIAPMITTIKGKAQNPYWLKKNCLAERLIYEGLKNKNRLPLYCGYAINKAIREIGLKRFRRSMKKEMYIYAAHGSFCVYPANVLEVCTPLFDENMFLFSEERYLAHEFENKGIKIILTKSISVIHKEDGSMSVAKINEDDEERKSTIYYYERLKKRKLVSKDNSKNDSIKTSSMLDIGSSTISVVMATYNGEKYIKDQIKSLLSQTRKPDEIIFCDDCSQDNTIPIIRGVMEGSGISYIIIPHDNNQGVVKSFQEAMLKASGDFIFFCDQDDVWKETKIEHFMKAFEMSGASLVFSDAEIVDEKLQPMNRTLWDSLRYDSASFAKSENNELLLQQYFVQEMLKRNIFTGMSMAFRRDLLLGFHGFSQYMLHDEFLGWLAISRGKIEPLNEQLVLYRQHEANAVGSKGIRKYQNRLETLRHIRTSTEKTYKKLNDVVKFTIMDAPKHKIKSAIEFYKERIQVYNDKKVIAFCKYLSNLIAGRYNLYTSRTEKAATKDLYMIIMKSDR